MKLVMTLLVRDERDIIQENLEYHLWAGVDFIIVTDNGSTDGTRDVLERYARAGRVHLLSQSDDAYRQGEWVTGMARTACTHFGADWVINADADEFWVSRGGTLKDDLGRVEAATDMLRVVRTNFVPTADEAGPFYERMTIRETTSLSPLGKRLAPKICHRGRADVEVGMGSHSVASAELRGIRETEAIWIAHFPIRSSKQFTSKVAHAGWVVSRNAANPGHTPSWRVLSELLAAGKLADCHAWQAQSPAELADGLTSGDLVIDTGLQIRLNALMGGVAEGGPVS